MKATSWGLGVCLYVSLSVFHLPTFHAVVSRTRSLILLSPFWAFVRSGPLLRMSLVGSNRIGCPPAPAVWPPTGRLDGSPYRRGPREARGESASRPVPYFLPFHVRSGVCESSGRRIESHRYFKKGKSARAQQQAGWRTAIRSCGSSAQRLVRPWPAQGDVPDLAPTLLLAVFLTRSLSSGTRRRDATRRISTFQFHPLEGMWNPMHWLVLLTGVTPMIVEYQPVQCTRSVRSGPVRD